jgi:DNA-binding NarL/FixJ family response regulator
MITVSVVEDHPVYRHGLADVIEKAEGLELVSAHRSIEDFDAVRPQAAVVLLDLHLPGLEGPDAVAHLVDFGYQVLVVSASVARGDVLAALAAGAGGYVSKDAESDQIAQAIGIVAGGGTFVSPTLASLLLQDDQDEGKPKLTPREREVLELVAEGAEDKAVARELGITLATVHSHLDRIRDKTGRRKRAELTRLAMEQGLVGRAKHPPDFGRS